MKKLQFINIFKNSKLRRGVFSLFVTLGAVLLMILLNLLAGRIEKANYNAMNPEFTYNSLYSYGEVTKAVLASIDEKETMDIHIFFVSNQGSENLELWELLERYAAQSKHILIRKDSLAANPTLATIYSDYTGDTAVSNDCLIFYCEATDRTRVLNVDDFIEYSYELSTGAYSVTGYTYEKSITEAILYVTTDNLPVIQVLTGHTELDPESKGEAALLKEKLISANFEVRTVDLLSGDTLDPDSMLMILSPYTDITGEELNKLTAFSAAGGDVFITIDYGDPDSLTNLFSFYRCYGFVPLTGIVVADAEDTVSYYGEVPYLIPTMLATDATGVLTTAGRDTLVLAGARGFETPGETDSSLSVRVALQSASTAYLRDWTDGITSLEKQENDPAGPFALALTGDWTQKSGIHSRAFIIGSSGIFNDDWTYTYTDAEALLMQVIQYLQGKDPVDLKIVAKPMDDRAMAIGSMVLPTLVIALLPVLTLILALCILLPRKYL